VGGLAAGLGWTIRYRPGRLRRRRGPPLAFPEVLDLLRRAHGAVAGWAVGPADGELEALAHDDLSPESQRRGSAIVQLSSVDGRLHVARDPEGTYVAAGDFPYGAGLLLVGQSPQPQVEQVAAELRRFVAGMRLAEEQVEGHRARLLGRQLARVASGAQTLEGIARITAELAQQLAQRGAAVVLATPAEPRILAVSGSADPRLVGQTLRSDSPVTQAMAGGVPVVARRGEDVFGPGMPERRRSERAGTAYPVFDGHLVVGSLVLIGGALEPDASVMEQVGPLIAELGPRLAAAWAVHDAEQRAIRDPLTGLANRREFERALTQYVADAGGSAPPATLIYVDLDHFKQLNDTLGHAAGDAALKHVARLLEAAVRDGDVVARIGGEEFAVWLPRTPFGEGVEVAERIRHSVVTSTWHWTGSPYSMSASCGVAAYPKPIGDVANLQAAADAALYRAKQAGRNRVEKAEASR
jgi:diguanylate cyclase (GGDEF)-like protein